MLSEEEALVRIVETVQQCEPAAAPFALVLGSGFSHGLVPTARELTEESLPLWMESLRSKRAFEELARGTSQERNSIARAFWERFAGRNNTGLYIDPVTGLPNDHSAAYRAAFDPNFAGAVGEPAMARRFQRRLMQLDRPRLNAAHFLLASLLGVQPGRSRRNDLFKAGAAFSRLILTTNFDPFLQIALQAVNRLYFMSDTPELGVGDDILDDQTDAIHLVYLHGSIHRRSQAATEDDIRTLKERNARILAPVLKRHGVIVLGYSGWDDAIVEALAACDRFDHRLYWCGREASPLTQGAFGPRVADILRKPAVAYVKIRTAGHFMAQLCTRLVYGLPRLLDNPIGQLREMLETIDLSELEPIVATASLSSPGIEQSDGRPGPAAFSRAQKATIERLKQSEQSFFTPLAQTPPAEPSETAQETANAAQEASNSRASQTQAAIASALGNYEESMRLYGQALENSALSPGERAELLHGRALTAYSAGRMDDAERDWTSIVELPGAPVEMVASGLVGRGFILGMKGLIDEALAEYTRVIEELPGASGGVVAMALINRSIVREQTGDADGQLADLNRVIEQLPNVPAEQVAMALVNRGITWGRRGNTDRQLADVNRVIGQLENVSEDIVARALASRGWAQYKRGAYGDFLSDTEAALKKVGSLAPAAFNLGLALLASGRDAEAILAYKSAAAQFPLEVEIHGVPDLLDAEKTWLSSERAEAIINVLRGPAATDSGK